MSIINLENYCCQANGKMINQSRFDDKDLILKSTAEGDLIFSPLGNHPSAPVIALVGITPGGQSTEFAKLLKTNSVEEAAQRAAFAGAQNVIKELLSAHGFASSIGISLDGDINESEQIFTTSLVKCCLKRKSDYLYKAPDILSSEEAVYCVKNKFLRDIDSHSSLKFIVMFGQPSWEAINGISENGKTIKEHLEAQGKTVLNFPHFAQNFQQRQLFCASKEESIALLIAKPGFKGYALKANQMKTALFNAVPDLASSSLIGEKTQQAAIPAKTNITKSKKMNVVPKTKMPKVEQSLNNFTSTDGFISEHYERKLRQSIEGLGLTVRETKSRTSKELAVFHNDNILCYINRKTGLAKGQMVAVITPKMAPRVDSFAGSLDHVTIRLGKTTRYISSSNYRLFNNVGDCPELKSNESFGAAYQIQNNSDMSQISDFLSLLAKN
jgi:hypothetical protein